jgi:hypothetical protein
MMDLNALIPANSPLYLTFAFVINDAGEIAGQAMEKSNGVIHAFVATPLPASGTAKFEPASLDTNGPMVLPEDVRKQFEGIALRRIGARVGGRR